MSWLEACTQLNLIAESQFEGWGKNSKKKKKYAEVKDKGRSSFSVSCTIAKDPPVLMSAGSDPTLWQRPDSFGRFGKFGGQYVPEMLMHELSELETLIEA
ncbi:hypothetical protein DY000_02046692 [Brassica cretica]|nr:hypothetical protein DY000_02046692 [Brassica cretica]